MKAVFIPLNHFIYNHHRYDGLSPASRILNPLDKKFYYKPLLKSLMVLFGIFFVPVVVVCWCFGKAHKFLDGFDEWMDETFFNLKDRFSPMEHKGFKIIVYYSPDQIPRLNFRKKWFEKRLAGIKSRFNALEVVSVKHGEDILDVIHRNNIDTTGSVIFTDKKVPVNLDELGRGKLLKVAAF